MNTMDYLILEAIQYISKISKKKVTEDSISTYLNNKGARNIDNTTPCVLNTGNSSLNAKFESLESKLYGEIIAIKSYFTDELRSLKNETTINKEQVCDINTEETTTLKNKIKLLELENKLLKDDITNKQKFIDTLLQHNLKLSQNFDISSIISVANEARKQPHERQHYGKNDTGLNN